MPQTANLFPITFYNLHICKCQFVGTRRQTLKIRNKVCACKTTLQWSQLKKKGGRKVKRQSSLTVFDASHLPRQQECLTDEALLSNARVITYTTHSRGWKVLLERRNNLKMKRQCLVLCINIHGHRGWQLKTMGKKIKPFKQKKAKQPPSGGIFFFQNRQRNNSNTWYLGNQNNAHL